MKGVKNEEIAFVSPLAFANEHLHQKKMSIGEDATKGQLNMWLAICRVLMRVEAVRAVSWLLASHAPYVTYAMGDTRAAIASALLTLMLPLVRQRAGAHRAILRSLFRWAVTLCCSR